MFFNKVDQAESLDCNLALCPLGRGDGSDLMIESSGDGFQFPVAKRVVQHCDLSVTTSGGCVL